MPSSDAQSKIRNCQEIQSLDMTFLLQGMQNIKVSPIKTNSQKGLSQ